MPVFEVIVLEHPKKKDAKNGELESIIFGPKCVIATDQQQAVLEVVMDHADMDIDRKRMEVLVRPFA